ncbi:MAG: hypothetical protein IT169_19665 [Bryobacterales bacterium]|nr:hypothetical protein [Bryobacterales bacterium]
MVVAVSERHVSGWKRFFMWDFPRGSVAYDIKVGAILAFIFLTPSYVFRDQPTLGKTKENIVMLPPAGAGERYWLEGGVVDAIPPQERVERISSLISGRTGRATRVVKIDAMQSAEGAVSGYVAITAP